MKSETRRRRFARIVATLVGASVLLSAAPAMAAMKITAAYYDPNSAGPDPDTNAGRNQEYIVVRNTGHKAVRLTGWTLRDLARRTKGIPAHVFKFPRFTLGAGKSVKIHTGKGTKSKTNLYWGSSVYLWGDDADKATLKNRGGTTVSTCSWTSADSSPKFC